MLVVGKGAASGKEEGKFSALLAPRQPDWVASQGCRKESTAVQSCWTWVKRAFILPIRCRQRAKRNTSMPIEVKPAVTRVQAYSPTGAYPCRSRHDGGGHRDERHGQPPCRRARRFPPSSRLRWLCHEYRLPKYLRTIRSIILSSGRPQRGHAC